MPEFPYVLDLLAGRTALVTGSGRGLGRAMANALARAGAQVVITSRHDDQNADAVAEIESFGGNAFAVRCDVRDASSVAAAVAAINDRFPGIDILINNAGINVKQPTVPLPVPEDAQVGQPGTGSANMGLSDEDWDGILDTHVRGPLHLIRAFAPGMLQRGWGRVINIGSSAVDRTPNFSSPYKVAKGALMHLTRTLAKEWAPYGVTCNAIAPGHFRTDMTKALHDSPEGQAWLRERIPMQRTGDARELGALAVYLSSDFASFITGQIVYVDGGETL